jgi:hypothetical protein
VIGLILAASLCAPNPASCGFPTAASTGYGVPASHLKVENSPIDITKAGEVLSYISTDQTINVDAPNVTIKHVRIIVSGGAFGIKLNRAANHTAIEDSTIRGSGTSGATAGIEAIKDIYGTGNAVTATGLNIYNFGDGIQTYQGSITNNYIHGLTDVNGYHLEDINENGNSGLPLLIQHNTLFNPASQTAAIYIGADFSPSANVTVNDNFVAGGGYTVYGGGQGVGPQANPANIKVTNNVFGRQYYGNSGFYGPVAYYDTGNGDVWSGNTYDGGGTVGP